MNERILRSGAERETLKSPEAVDYAFERAKTLVVANIFKGALTLSTYEELGALEKKTHEYMKALWSSDAELRVLKKTINQVGDTQNELNLEIRRREAACDEYKNRTMDAGMVTDPQGRTHRLRRLMTDAEDMNYRKMLNEITALWEKYARSVCRLDRLYASLDKRQAPVIAFQRVISSIFLNLRTKECKANHIGGSVDRVLSVLVGDEEGAKRDVVRGLASIKRLGLFTVSIDFEDRDAFMHVFRKRKGSSVNVAGFYIPSTPVIVVDRTLTGQQKSIYNHEIIHNLTDGVVPLGRFDFGNASGSFTLKHAPTPERILEDLKSEIVAEIQNMMDAQFYAESMRDFLQKIEYTGLRPYELAGEFAQIFSTAGSQFNEVRKHFGRMALPAPSKELLDYLDTLEQEYVAMCIALLRCCIKIDELPYEEQEAMRIELFSRLLLVDVAEYKNDLERYVDYAIMQRRLGRA